MTEVETDMLLRQYAAGETGTLRTIEALGVRDYANLVIAMVWADLPLPRSKRRPTGRTWRGRGRCCNHGYGMAI